MNPIYFYVILLITEKVLGELNLAASAELCSRCTFWVGVWAILYVLFFVFAVIGKAAK